MMRSHKNRVKTYASLKYLNWKKRKVVKCFDQSDCDRPNLNCQDCNNWLEEEREFVPQTDRPVVQDFWVGGI